MGVGNTLKINFRTSARGFIQVKFLDEYNNPIEGFISCDHFGDTTKRIIDFDKPLKELKNREVKLDFTMSDAEIYSITFED